jgi:hypothetical protein
MKKVKEKKAINSSRAYEIRKHIRTSSAYSPLVHVAPLDLLLTSLPLPLSPPQT